MRTRVSIMFPYNADDNLVFERLDRIIEEVSRPQPNNRLHTSCLKPILVVNMDTIYRGGYDRFLKNSRYSENVLEEKLDIVKIWAVDTCQMWLEGFGKIIKDIKSEESEHRTAAILQIPGDLKYIQSFPEFVDQLSNMRAQVEGELGPHLIIGDFDVDPQKSKHLIDLHGTYPLFYNWFPNIARTVREKYRIKRPRSEFLAIKIEFLGKILPFTRKFAYEQTLAFLIHALLDNYPWQIVKVHLGSIGDYETGRGLKEATDQIERTERMLKLLYREKNGGDNFSIASFQLLDRRSTSIREAGLVVFENFLSNGQEYLDPVALRNRIEDLEDIIKGLRDDIGNLKTRMDAVDNP